jgi:hypothetical protein
MGARVKLFGKLPAKATPDAGTTALRACAMFCLEPETFPAFAEWAVAPDRPCK